mmetsp:Transcript_51981/g.111214  ORF Transcript_51981/g.111214 Transcript_51981/m.111214 type:complete len:297 (-) Transcript_51981:510-1400(-)
MDMQEFLRRHPICLVQDNADLVIATGDGRDAPLELIRYVQLVHVEEEEDQPGVLCKPAHDLLVVVAPPDTLLIAGQHSRGVDESHTFEDGVGHLRALHPREETVAIGAKGREGQALIMDDRMARDGLGLRSMTHCDEAIRGRFRTNLNARVVVPQEVPDKGCLSGRVLTHHQDHGPARKEARRQLRRMETVEAALPLERQQLLPVQLLKPCNDACEVTTRGAPGKEGWPPRPACRSSCWCRCLRKRMQHLRPDRPRRQRCRRSHSKPAVAAHCLGRIRGPQILTLRILGVAVTLLL